MALIGAVAVAGAVVGAVTVAVAVVGGLVADVGTLFKNLEKLQFCSHSI